MKDKVISLRVDEDFKKAVDDLYQSMGLSTTTAIMLFMTQSLIERKLPFTPKAPPNNRISFDRFPAENDDDVVLSSDFDERTMFDEGDPMYD
jgi:DNA-damage-inducible protein J